MFITLTLGLAKTYKHDLNSIASDLSELSVTPALLGSVSPSLLPDFFNDAPTMRAGQRKWDPAKRYSANCQWDVGAAALFVAEAQTLMRKLAHLRAIGWL